LLREPWGKQGTKNKLQDKLFGCVSVELSRQWFAAHTGQNSKRSHSNAAISARKLRDTHSALMVHVHCAANNPCIKLSIVLGGTYMVIMEVEKEQNKTKQNKTKHACAFSPAVWSQNSSSSVVCSLWHHCSHLVSPVTWYSSRRPPAQPTWFEIYR